jgi:hypothetical protein
MTNVRKVIKVLAGKTRGLDKKAKIKEMNHGLTILNLLVLRQKRDHGFSAFSFETLDAVDLILKRAQATR